MRRRSPSTELRAELLADEQWLLSLAERIGCGSGRAGEAMRRRIADLESGRAVSGLHGWEVGMPPDSGPWTLTADDRLIAAQARDA